MVGPYSERNINRGKQKNKKYDKTLTKILKYRSAAEAATASCIFEIASTFTNMREAETRHNKIEIVFLRVVL